MSIGQHFYGTLTCEAREQTHTNTMKCCFFDQKSAGKGLQKMISRTSTPSLGSTFLALSPGRSVNKHQDPRGQNNFYFLRKLGRPWFPAQESSYELSTPFSGTAEKVTSNHGHESPRTKSAIFQKNGHEP